MGFWYHPKCLNLGELAILHGLSGSNAAGGLPGCELPYRFCRLRRLGLLQ